jgi:phage tail sheath protein FI
VTARRFALWLQACVLDGTRWMLDEAADSAAYARARAQVGEFLSGLAAEGRLAGSQPADCYYVICDERLHREPVLQVQGRRLLFAFALQRPGEFQCCLVSHGPAGSSVRTVAVNQLADPGSRHALQFGTAILRQLEGLPA